MQGRLNIFQAKWRKSEDANVIKYNSRTCYEHDELI